MINLEIITDKNDIIKKIILSGHADFDLKGKDIVCAAVSVLVYSFFNTITTYNSVECNLTEESDFVIEVKNYSETILFSLEGLTRYCIIGLKSLSEKYPHNIKICFKRS